ncbi:RNA 3'-terminal phosphate cyclase [Mycena sanguinolenta]|uniref:RNA 3'-terminal phosphate cyclase n=1 Tax=Mycena sanguinolenta TaxID=230812 RepID=A0A8H6YE34_9AGAR|nr:RNA 3'-terminal phosphate cyclase [Mycena sanguinolenta]
MQGLAIIDGSVLEGGGQILRNSISLSALLGKPINIEKVRNSRKPPGLKNQHRTGVSSRHNLAGSAHSSSFAGIELAAKIASAQLTGATNGSSDVSFTPKRITPGDYTADSVTAGAVALLLQISLPILLFARSPTPSTLTLKGGTNATLAPQVDYIQHVFLPFATRHFGLKVDVDVRRRGYFPKGGGEVHVTVFPGVDGAKLTAASVLERGAVTRIGGIAHVAGLPAHLAKTMADSAIARLAASGFASDASVSVPVDISCTREKNENTVGAGSGIVLWAELEGGGMIGGSAVGSKQKDAVRVGEEAADELIKGARGRWMRRRVAGRPDYNLHGARRRTAIWVAEQLTNAKFQVTVEESGHTIIRCIGIGYSPPSV